jgi:S-adenosylmethionine decarboxylase
MSLQPLQIDEFSQSVKSFDPSVSHETLGTHVIVELSGCPFDRLNDPTLIDRVFTRAIELAGATLIQKVSHKFTPHGLSMVFVLSESHLSIHTWPERTYAAVDIYTCGKCMPHVAIDYIQRELEAASFHRTTLKRGLPDPDLDQTYYHEIKERS